MKLRFSDKDHPEHIKSILLLQTLYYMGAKNKRLQEQLKDINKDGNKYFIKTDQ